MERGAHAAQPQETAMQNTIAMPKYMNLYLHSDVRPFEVVRVISGKTLEIREMTATLDPSWTADRVPGGFAGHVRNNDSQRWIIKSEPNNQIVRARLTKSGRWSVGGCERYLASDEPVYRYDFNF
jgi:hypothetical protein